MAWPFSDLGQPHSQPQPQPGLPLPDVGPEAMQTQEVEPGIVFMPARPWKERPLYKLTGRLLETFNLINQRYYEAKKRRRQLAEEAERQGSKEKKARPNNGHDDEEYNYIVKVNEKLKDRYVVDSSLGKGSFGRVVKAYDTKENTWVAIKIVKSKHPFFVQAQIEISILTALQKDPEKWNVVRVRDTFMHMNHQCLVFELLSVNLFDLLQSTNFAGISLNLIGKFAKQLLVTLHYLSGKHGKDGRAIIHCDLKPENILLRSSKKTSIKVIDFGSACFANQKMYTYIQSRFYRAPEVLLGLDYGPPIDMWSLGCILMEMHTGKPLFDGANEGEQIIRHVELLGLPPHDMILRGRRGSKYFAMDPERGWTVRSKHHRGKIGTGDLRPALGDKWRDTPVYTAFLDLVRRMLEYDPKKRIRPEAARRHPFFTVAGITIKDEPMDFIDVDRTATDCETPPPEEPAAAANASSSSSSSSSSSASSSRAAPMHTQSAQPLPTGLASLPPAPAAAPAPSSAPAPAPGPGPVPAESPNDRPAAMVLSGNTPTLGPRQPSAASSSSSSLPAPPPAHPRPPPPPLPHPHSHSHGHGMHMATMDTSADALAASTSVSVSASASAAAPPPAQPRPPDEPAAHYSHHPPQSHRRHSSSSSTSANTSANGSASDGSSHASMPHMLPPSALAVYGNSAGSAGGAGSGVFPYPDPSAATATASVSKPLCMDESDDVKVSATMTVSAGWLEQPHPPSSALLHAYRGSAGELGGSCSSSSSSCSSSSSSQPSTPVGMSSLPSDRVSSASGLLINTEVLQLPGHNTPNSSQPHTPSSTAFAYGYPPGYGYGHAYGQSGPSSPALSGTASGDRSPLSPPSHAMLHTGSISLPASPLWRGQSGPPSIYGAEPSGPLPIPQHGARTGQGQHGHGHAKQRMSFSGVVGVGSANSTGSLWGGSGGGGGGSALGSPGHNSNQSSRKSSVASITLDEPLTLNVRSASPAADGSVAPAPSAEDPGEAAAAARIPPQVMGGSTIARLQHRLPPGTDPLRGLALAYPSGPVDSAKARLAHNARKYGTR